MLVRFYGFHRWFLLKQGCHGIARPHQPDLTVKKARVTEGLRSYAVYTVGRASLIIYRRVAQFGSALGS